jgi:hypothetical protein
MDAAATRVIDGFTMRVLHKLENAAAALDGALDGAPPGAAGTAGTTGTTGTRGSAGGAAPAHLVLVDARLWQESHEEIEARARPNTEVVYISRPVDVAIYLHETAKKFPKRLAAVESINLLFHGSPYDADGKPIDKDDEEMASKAASIEVLGARLSVKEADVAEMVGITQKSTAADKQASREKYPEYWELRDAMVELWNATEAKKAPFYLYACNLARIAGFKELFRGFDRPVFGSTDVTGPAAAQNWRVEWESEGGAVSDTEAVHAEAEVFDRPGAMKLELFSHIRCSVCHLQFKVAMVGLARTFGQYLCPGCKSIDSALKGNRAKKTTSGPESSGTQ